MITNSKNLPMLRLQQGLVIFFLICDVIKSKVPLETTAPPKTTKKTTIIVIIFRHFVPKSI